MKLKPMNEAPKDGSPVLCKRESGSWFITAWTNDVYKFQGGSGGGSGWFSGQYDDHWGDRPRFDRPVGWVSFPEIEI